MDIIRNLFTIYEYFKPTIITKWLVNESTNTW